MSLPTDAKARKSIPIATGFVDYFPKAMAAVAELSRIGNDQHNPGQPLHWAKEKSIDHADCLIRHFIERGTVDSDGVLHDVKVAWRAMAMLETLLEKQMPDEKTYKTILWRDDAMLLHTPHTVAPRFDHDEDST